MSHSINIRSRADRIERLLKSQKHISVEDVNWPVIYKDWTKRQLQEVANWPQGKPYSDEIIQHLKESGYHGPFE